MQNSFLSPELLKISSDADSTILSHINDLDRVSNDIKVLETTLYKAAIPFTFIYVLFSKKIIDKNAGYYGADIEKYEDHCLIWEQTKDKGSRLFYNVYYTEDQVGNTRVEGVPFLKSSKPLIETKALFRLDIEKELPNFYQSLINQLKSKKQTVEFSPRYNENSTDKDDGFLAIFRLSGQIRE